MGPAGAVITRRLCAVSSVRRNRRDRAVITESSVARTHGRLALQSSLSDSVDTLAAIVRSAEGLSVRLQLLSSRNRTLWPTERRTILQRYSDAPVAKLRVPTLPAFAASKTATWSDRHAPRDLWDLWALTEIGAIDAAAAELYRRYGPTNRLPGRVEFRDPPPEAEWIAQLTGQTRLNVTAREAADVVREAWARAAAAAGN
jgi:hypothetical protein